MDPYLLGEIMKSVNTATGKTIQQTPAHIQERILIYEKDLVSCLQDISEIDPETDGNPDAATALANECERRIAYYIPALKELHWMLGVDYKKDRTYFEILMILRKEPDCSVLPLARLFGKSKHEMSQIVANMVLNGDLWGPK